MFFLGAMLLATSLSAGWLRRMPVTPFALYALAGFALGPTLFDVAHVDFVQHAHWLGGISEGVLVVSLFLTGLKLRLPWRHPSWHVGCRLAAPAMLLCVAALAWATHAWLALPWAAALVFAAMAAPTDPVLASLVSVDDARDGDALRVALSSEAGLNDGAALPLLMLGLLCLSGTTDLHGVWQWFWLDVGWALPAGLAIGFGLARLVGIAATRAKMASGDRAPSDFLALALILLAYACAKLLDASGFLAVFAAGIGLRHTEWRVVSQHPHPHAGQDQAGQAHPPAEMLVNPNQRDEVALEEPSASIGLVVSDALSFGDTLERLLAAGTILVVGIACAGAWSMAGAWMGLLLFVVIRPVSVWIATMGLGTPPVRRLLMGWLGIRGIGSLNYLGYALTHGLPAALAPRITAMVTTLVVLSVVVHGVSCQPLLAWRERRLRERGR
ncbi:cation:proton antiporter [Dyella jejuensis]|uniref:Cation:proton antiporter n=2 Tax=Dyella jejuensis TaxID=1432009 RepID=A0ABW8JK36_9GAMM